MCVFAMTPDTDECLHCQCMYQCHVSDTVTRMTKVDIIKLVFGKYSAISLNRMAIRNIAQAVLQAFLFKQEFLFFCFPNLAILFIFSLFLGNLAMFLLFFQTVTCNPACLYSHASNNPWTFLVNSTIVSASKCKICDALCALPEQLYWIPRVSWKSTPMYWSTL